jgi:hypothetical protein
MEITTSDKEEEGPSSIRYNIRLILYFLRRKHIFAL